MIFLNKSEYDPNFLNMENKRNVKWFIGHPEDDDKPFIFKIKIKQIFFSRYGEGRNI